MFLKKATRIAAGKITDVQTSSGLIKITLPGYGLATGNAVIIYGVVGVPADGLWLITEVDANNFTLQGSTFSGAVTNLDNAYAYVGDRVVINASSYPGTAAHISTKVRYIDQATGNDADFDTIRKTLSAGSTDVVIAWASPLYHVSVESINILNRHASADLVVMAKMLDYLGTAIEYGSATAEFGERIVISGNGFGDVILPTGRSANGAIGGP